MGNHLDLTPKLERKCKLCAFGETEHQANTQNCPIGSPSTRSFYRQYYPNKTFTDSGKFTLKSQRVVRKYEQERQRREESERLLAQEKAKVRAMTYEELITATVELLTDLTGLGIIVERRQDWCAELHLTTLGGKVWLGYTTVSQYSDGRYAVGGTSAGSFMSNHSDKCLSNLLRGPFKALEEKANAEKK